MFRTKNKTHVHFVGIGGIGMSGIAEVLIDSGYMVSGSDIFRSENIDKLERLGVKINIGHRADNVQGANVVVYSSAIDADNPEIKYSQLNSIPLIKRAEMLAEVMRLKVGLAVAGSHGKTTTTSFLATILHECGLDPTYIIGGIVENLKGHAKVGRSDYLVAEADESDGSFLLLSPVMSVITNIDNDHLDYYRSEDKLFEAFLEFANKVPFYGCCALNFHDEKLRNLKDKLKKPWIYFGIFEDGAREAEMQARNVVWGQTDSSFDLFYQGEFQTRIELALPGRHNVLNALGAICLAYKMELSFSDIGSAISKCHGVGRRFERIYMDERLEVIDDYGHHPSEILSTLQTARSARPGKLFVVFEPHRYSRTQNCWEQFLDCFCSADKVFITPIYPASEKPLEVISHTRLVEEINSRHAGLAEVLPSLETLSDLFSSLANEKCTVMTLGAGAIGRKSREALKNLRPIDRVVKRDPSVC